MQGLLAAIPTLLVVPLIVALPAFAHPAVLLALVLWTWCLWAPVKQALRVPLSQIPWSVLALACFLAWNAYSFGNEYGREKVLNWLATSLPLLLWPSLVRITPAHFPALAWGQLLAGLVVIPSLVTLNTDFYSEAAYIFVAMFGGLAALSGLTLPYLQKPFLGRVLSLHGARLLTLAGILSVLLSGSRGAVVAMLLAMLVIPAIYGLRMTWKYIAIAGVVGLLLIALPGLWSAQLGVIEERLSDETWDTTLALRWGGVVTAWETFTANPLTGIGAGNYATLDEVTELVRYPHNLFLELGAEFGIVAVLLMAYLLLVSLKALWKVRTIDRAASAFALASFLFLLIHAMKMGDISTHRLLYLWIGIALAVRK